MRRSSRGDCRSRTPGAIPLAIALFLMAAASPAASQPASEWPIVELRVYTLKPGQRDVLISLFEAEFVESQEAVGMRILGTFRDANRPDRFVWIRAFTDMAARADGLKAFYSGPVWKAHGKAAAATMIDASNVLLLREARPGAGFALARTRPPKGSTAEAGTEIVANIYSFNTAVDPSFVEFFERKAVPLLNAAGISILASFVTETAANNYPPLPVRADDRVFVWFARFADRGDYDRRLAALTRMSSWPAVADRLQMALKSPPDVLQLHPTPRSDLRD